MALSIVIPAHNESGNINKTIQECIDIVGQTRFADDYEIIVVDDHSGDTTFAEVSSLDIPQLQCHRLSRQMGSHTALRAGIKLSTGSLVLCVSADGQDDPGALKEMIDKWEQGAHIVWALRKSRSEPMAARIFAFVFYRVIHMLAGTRLNNIDLSRADFYLLDRKVADAVNACGEANTSLFGLIYSLGFKQESVEYERRQRLTGSSKWNFKSRFKLATDWIIAFSGLPLKLMTVFGFFTAGLGFLYALFLITSFILKGNPVLGWSSTMVVILILGGIQMIMFGIIGEYLWRNLDESRKRPVWFIEQSTEKN